MRYFHLGFQRHSSILRWFHFADRRPWLDLEGQKEGQGEERGVDLTVQLLGAGAGAMRLGVVDRTGAPVEVVPQEAQLPKGRPAFLGQPEETRQIWRGRIVFDAPQPVYLVDTISGTQLAEVRPELKFPEFLFALREEMRRGFCADGLPNMVETGTLFGHTTLHASYWFDQVTTIELSTELHAQARAHLAHRPNIRCVQGASGEMLPQVVAELDGPTLFFLDAHWSGDASVDWEGALFSGYPVDTARLTQEGPDATGLDEADRQVPLMAELRCIADTHSYRGVVLIDDWSGVGRKDYAFQGEDWSNLEHRHLIEWFDNHPRTAFHHPLDQHRYVWGLDPIAAG